MIIGKCFEGDDDERLKGYGHSCYEESLERWIYLAGHSRLRYHRLPEWEEVNEIRSVRPGTRPLFRQSPVPLQS